MSLSDREDKVFTITTTYEDTDGAQPITFLDNVEGDVYDDDYYTLMKHDTVTGLRDVGIMYLCRFGIDEEPDHGIEEFSTIHPGQSITEEITLKHGECPHDFWEGDIGFKFTYCFEGKKLQWWDWGTEEVGFTLATDQRSLSYQADCFIAPGSCWFEDWILRDQSRQATCDCDTERNLRVRDR